MLLMFPNRRQYDRLGQQQYPSIDGNANDVDDKMEDSLNSSILGDKDKSLTSSSSSSSSPQPPPSKKGNGKTTTTTASKKKPEKKKKSKQQKRMKEHTDDVVDRNPPTAAAAAAAASRGRGGAILESVADSATGVGLIGGKNPPRMTSVDDSTMLPEWYVPSEDDVIVSWARQNHAHRGNERFRMLVDKYAPVYAKASTKYHKSEVIAAIVTEVRSNSRLGGFVKKDFYSGRWFEIGDEKARDKVGHAIRKAAAELQTEESGGAGSHSKKQSKAARSKTARPKKKIKELDQPGKVQPGNESTPLDLFRKKDPTDVMGLASALSHGHGSSALSSPFLGTGLGNTMPHLAVSGLPGTTAPANLSTLEALSLLNQNQGGGVGGLGVDRFAGLLGSPRTQGFPGAGIGPSGSANPMQSFLGGSGNGPPAAAAAAALPQSLQETLLMQNILQQQARLTLLQQQQQQPNMHQIVPGLNSSGLTGLGNQPIGFPPAATSRPTAGGGFSSNVENQLRSLLASAGSSRMPQSNIPGDDSNGPNVGPKKF